MTAVPVNEMFQTIQGEARHTGTPSVFLRLQGCAVGCPWCDTKHTWAVNPTSEITPRAMLRKTEDVDTWAAMSVENIMDALAGFQARHVVITGGEPCQYDLAPLCSALISSGRTVQVETSGTQPIRVSGSTWVTLSPKIGMPGRFPILGDAVARADEIKMPVGKPSDIDVLTTFLAEHKYATSLVWLQPLSRSAKATKLCIDAATERGWKVSIQTHALIGVR